ncbi:MAG: diguanylate cyclase, partial [Nakamurella sp.]
MTEPLEDNRLEQLVDLIVQLAAGDLSARLDPSEAADSVDAVITGFNLLADELDHIYRTLEDRVAERTFALDQARVELERLALNDALTGLANRTLLGDRIRQATARADRGARPPSVLVLDLDEFKTINDSLGHGAGDQILVEVARRINSVVRDTDTVARLGGDEFAILMPDASEDDVLRVAERVLKELQNPLTVGDRAVWAGASIGLCFGLRGQSADNLLRDADTAMYAAKANGRGNIQVFKPEMHHAARERLQTASELAAAIANRELELYYQPIVELDSGRIIGAEALVRWAHPERGLLLPAEFISVAEDSGHIIELGHWVIKAGIAQLQSWTEQFPQPFQLHVNLSPVEVRWPGVAQFIRET